MCLSGFDLEDKSHCVFDFLFDFFIALSRLGSIAWPYNALFVPIDDLNIDSTRRACSFDKADIASRESLL